jgi:plasmid stabilization system protein ParE
MPNIYKVIWTDSALDELKGVVDFLHKEWTEKEIQSFARNLEKNITVIQTYPKIFPYSKSLNLYKSVLSKHNSLIYDISGEKIIIMGIFDNRQDPEKLNRPR